MKSIIPHNLTGKSLYDYLVKNEGLIFHTKKSTTKRADEVYAQPLYIDDKGNLVTKAEVDQTQIDPNKLKVVAVINTTNWLDSHGDVHIPGIWKKSLSDNKKVGFYLLKSHGREFEDVIGDGLKGLTKKLSWSELGVDIPGITEALIFDGIIEKDRNEYMFEQYSKKRVKKHSVGMRYIKMVTCINDDDYPVQKENWDKYIQVVANRDEAEADGYFWAILEAQIIEGSAVLFGSNPITPTMEATLIQGKTDSEEDTKDQPPVGTGNEPSPFDLSRAIKEVKIIV
jgi:hypothetical protein